MTIEIDLFDRTALVTGSTSGIGFAIARELADAGARVLINGRSQQRVAAAVARARNELPEGLFQGVTADVTDADAVGELVATHPNVDVLVNNLGVFGAEGALKIDDGEWRRYFDTNVLTAVRLTRDYFPRMQDTGWGRVLNIASDSAVATPAEMIHYGVSKTALLAVSRGFAKAAAGTGVTVNSVIAGPTHTEGVEDFVYQLVDRTLPWAEAQRESMRVHRPQSLVQRLIEPAEIAHMVAYLASPLASATTGGAVRVDGGYVDSILP